MQGPDIWDKLVSLENRRQSLGLTCFLFLLFFSEYINVLHVFFIVKQAQLPHFTTLF